MSFQISVLPGQEHFSAEAGESLVDAALRQGFLLPYSCRDGVCGACRGKVLAGAVEHGRAVISQADREAGYALFCCASAKSDLTIESREIRSSQVTPVKTLPARIEQLERLAPDVMRVVLALPETAGFAYQPGQYIDILLKGGKRRAFSLANAPRADGRLELHIRRVPGGFFTEQVFATLKVRDILRFNGPHGSFRWHDSAKPALLVAGGTGFAPIKALVEQLLPAAETPAVAGRTVTLYWGGKTSADLYLATLAEAWAERYPFLRFVPVLSDASPEDSWRGRRGLVHEALMADYPDLSGHQVYVCGSPAMVGAVRRDLVGQCHLPEEELFADSFEFARDVME